ncbi:MAG: hypothetical protein LBR97_06775 [Dysgonamonadaceae bacterium]|jgi:hypothetical protein|nr:hypothetical protein [Dysgonamonadaceae bacterium]
MTKEDIIIIIISGIIGGAGAELFTKKVLISKYPKYFKKGDLLLDIIIKYFKKRKKKRKDDVVIVKSTISKSVNERINTKYDLRTDSNGQDIDSHSETLRQYHKILWSKALPNGKILELSDIKGNTYLYHKSELGEFFFGSDAITHSYKNHKRKQWIVRQIPSEVDELYAAGCTVGSYIIFPGNQIDGKNTINQERGCNYLIDDRFDLTLECIRRFYSGQASPLYDTLKRYKSFFDLFGNFRSYVNFFLLQDLVDEQEQIKFYLPFDDFAGPPIFSNVEDYLLYKKRVMNFIDRRNGRISKLTRSRC